MRIDRKALICAALAALLTFSGCQENQVVDNGNVRLESVDTNNTSDTDAPEVTEESEESAEETTAPPETTTTEKTTTTKETTANTEEAEQSEEESASETAEPEETAAVSQTEYTMLDDGTFRVPATAATAAQLPTPTQSSSSSSSSGSSSAAASTTARTTAAAPAVTVVTTKEHTSGYQYGNTKYEIKHDLEYLRQINTDVVGWLKIDDTPIDLPVVQASDNKFYLTHDFYGKEDPTKVGVTFADCHVPITATSRPDNIVIYGHNIRTGVGLAKITNYYPARYGSLRFYITHPLISYESAFGGQSNYVVFAGMFVNTQTAHGSVFNYHKFRNFGSQDVFYQYFEAVMDRSVFYNPDLDIKYDDKFLTLSTCYYPMGANIDTRFVVFARQVRPGETVITSKNAYTNRSPLYFDYYYKVNGGSWGGRKWSADLIQGYAEWKKTH